MRELERDRTDIHAPPPAPSPIAVIGRGRVGGSLTAQASAAGIDVRGAGREGIADACRGAEIALLCVPDDQIALAAASVAALQPPPRFVGHVSGAAGLDVLADAGDSGASLFSRHPLQTIPDGSTPITGAPAAIAGSDPDGLETARRLAEALQMRPFEVAEEDRAAYHAAAAIASNFLVALEESAGELLAAAGIENGRELLAPLVLRSAANWAERGSEALTGPIARGDDATVSRHREALATTAPQLIPMYEAMAELTRSLADRGRER
jgi:predicted short-subunit dehydrogenase-like oxidoreductase (DUF2520 family)